MEPPVPSPDKQYYRNKVEFTIGHRLVEEVRVVAEGVKLEGDSMGEGKVARAMVEEKKESRGTKDAENIKVPVAVEDAGFEKVSTLQPNTEAEVKEEKIADTEVKLEDTPTETKQPLAIQKIPAAGFLAQGWSGGVYPPHCLKNMPDWACAVCDVFNAFLPESPLPPYDSKVHRGVWRTVTVRCSLRTRECMVIVVHAPAEGGAGAAGDATDDHSRAFEGEKRRLVEMLTASALPTPTRDCTADQGGEGGTGPESVSIRVTSIFFQEFVGLSNPSPEHPVQVSC